MNKQMELWIIVVLILKHGLEGCPVINIAQTPSSDAGLQTSITTIVQGDQIKEIFENVSKLLLDSADTRFMKFLNMNDVRALPKDCQDIRTLGYTTTGVYTIYLVRSAEGTRVRCDMETDKGGWTVIQRRVNKSVDFYRDWNDYQTGFGDVSQDYWLGNQQIHLLTSSAWYELRVDMAGPSGDARHITSNVFKVGDLESGYKLTIDGLHGDKGMIKDIIYHSGSKFSTYDRDQDSHSTSNCAAKYKGGWWYNACHNVNINGVFGGSRATGVIWETWTTDSKSLTSVEMKIRRYQK